MTRKRSGKAALFLALILGLFAWAGEPKQTAYGVILATVFRETGHALAGAEVEVKADPEGPVTGKKPKAQKLAASGRGEVVFRVPPGPMRYTLTVKAKGYQPQSKTVNIQADERQDVNFLLEVEKQ
jgi:Carboxypeptidase regulatory-like domain